MDQVSIMIVGTAVALAALIVTMIGSLRRDIDKRFDGMEKRFEERFRSVETRFEERFEGIDRRFDGVDRRLDGIDMRLRSVEQGLSEAKGKLAFVESYILGRTESAQGEVPAE